MANTHSLNLVASSNQYASITDASQTGLDVTGDFTIEFWMNLTTLPSTGGSLYVPIAKDRASERGYVVFINNTTNQLNVEYFDGTVGGNQTAARLAGTFNSSDLGVWTHIGITADVSVPSILFYRDGGTAAGSMTATAATSIVNNSNSFNVGNFSSGTQYFFNGKLDEVRIWSGTIRTLSDISSNYNQEIGTNINLKGYWQFNNDYTDASGNGNTLTAFNSPTFSTDVPFGGAAGATGFMTTNTRFWGA